MCICVNVSVSVCVCVLACVVTNLALLVKSTFNLFAINRPTAVLP